MPSVAGTSPHGVSRLLVSSIHRVPRLILLGRFVSTEFLRPGTILERTRKTQGESDFPGTKDPCRMLLKLHLVSYGEQARVQSIEGSPVERDFAAVVSQNAPTEALLVELDDRSPHLRDFTSFPFVPFPGAQ